MKLVEGIRSERDKLYKTLFIMRFRDNNGEIPTGKLMEYERCVWGLMAVLKKDCSYILDTRSLDQELNLLAEKMYTAIQSGNLATADRILKLLVFGIILGHTTTLSDVADPSDPDIEERINVMTEHRRIIKLFLSIDQMEDSVQRFKCNKSNEDSEFLKSHVKLYETNIAMEKEMLEFMESGLTIGKAEMDMLKRLGDSVRPNCPEDLELEEEMRTIEEIVRSL